MAPRGRPRKVYHVQGRAAAKARDIASFGDGTPPQGKEPSEAASPSPEPKGLFTPTESPSSVHGDVGKTRYLSKDESRVGMLALQGLGAPKDDIARACLEDDSDDEPGTHPPFLPQITRQPSIWKYLGKIPLHTFPEWHDNQLQDYGSNGTAAVGRYVNLRFSGHPEDTPHDIRARSLVLEWKDYFTESQKLKAAEDKRIVYRKNMRCCGRHNLVNPDDVEEANEDKNDDESDDEGADSADGEASEEEMLKRKKRDRSSRCDPVHPVVLCVEVSADDLGQAHLWQSYDHPNSEPWQLEWSRRLRNITRTRLRCQGAKISDLKKELANGSLAVSLSSIPPHRRPSDQQLNDQLPGIRHRAYLDKSPFKAISIIAQHNSESVYCYKPYSNTEGDNKSSFKVALADRQRLEALMLNATERGMAMDSSWRNKNESRAPMTALITVDDQLHLVPGAVLLSANVKEETLVTFLEATNAKILEHARSILQDPNKMVHQDPQEREVILETAQKVIRDGILCPSHFMIDKCLAQLKALKRAYPNVPIRLCQFHVIQAIMRWDTDKSSEKTSGSISLPLKHKICVAFRKLQRCNDWSEWEDATTEFYQTVDALVDNQIFDDLEGLVEVDTTQNKRRRKPKLTPEARKEEQKAFLHRYFDRNWFTDLWIPHFTDIGLPEGQTRDETWNTNNWSESNFKSFDKIFLGSRTNKRIDRLVMIILFDYFPYYNFWRGAKRRPSKKLLAISDRGRQLWERGLILPLANGKFDVEDLARDPLNPEQLVQVVHVVDVAIATCSCSEFEQTGKECSHLYASRLFVKAGSVEAHQKLEMGVTKGNTNKNKNVKKTKGKRLRSDRTEKRDLFLVLSKLENDSMTTEGLENLGSASDSSLSSLGIESEGEEEFTPRESATIGRPKNQTPLQPHRSKSKSGHSGKTEHGTRPKVSKTSQASQVVLTPQNKSSKVTVTPQSKVSITSATPQSNTSPSDRNVRFSKRPGPPKSQRLHDISLFPASARDIITTSPEQHVTSPGRGSSKTNPGIDPYIKFKDNPGFSANPNFSDNDNHLNIEDVSLYSTNLQRWSSDYLLRFDEMDIFVSLLNTLSSILGAKVLSHQHQ